MGLTMQAPLLASPHGQMTECSAKWGTELVEPWFDARRRPRSGCTELPDWRSEAATSNHCERENMT